MWNYLYFIVYLKEKDPTTFNGPEQYVSDLLKANELRWVPQHRCLVFDQQNEEESYSASLAQIRNSQTFLHVTIFLPFYF